jgi:hypothetical protein
MKQALPINWVRTSIVAAVVSFGLCIGGTVRSEGAKISTSTPTSPVSEYALKAAFLYNFALFTEWPERVEKSLHLCVLGRDPFGSALDALAGKDANGARIAIFRLRSVKEALQSCQIIFITDAEVDAVIAQLADSTGVKGVLTVAEREGAARAGIMIEMIAENSKVDLEFNLLNAKKSGVSISSKLLRLAKKIY